MDRKQFYDVIRVNLARGTLTQSQVNGFETLLNEWESRGLEDLRLLTYMLATTWHETAATMQPIEEYGKGKGKPYAPYYGRGYVQITWESNYRRAGKKVNFDLVGRPDMALQPEVATKILFDGMLEGWFTGKKLSDYITPTTCDYLNARRIVNATDAAALIAGYADTIFQALDGASHPPNYWVMDGQGRWLPVYNDDISSSAKDAGAINVDAIRNMGNDTIKSTIEHNKLYRIIARFVPEGNGTYLTAVVGMVIGALDMLVEAGIVPELFVPFIDTDEISGLTFMLASAGLAFFRRSQQ